MKKMLFICAIVVVLLAVCGLFQNNSNYLYDTNDVLDLIAANELPCRIIDVKVVGRGHNFTGIFIELYVAETECSTNEYFCKKQYELPPGIVDKLIDYGVKDDSIADFGINYKDFIIEKKNSIEYRPYSIYWFKLNDNLQNKSNVLVYASIPHEITIERENTQDGSIS